MAAEITRFWDLGENEIITPSAKNLASILNALILCGGKLHGTHSQEARDGEWAYPTRSCAVAFRISLPLDMAERFEKLSGFKLEEPEEVHVNTYSGGGAR